MDLAPAPHPRPLIDLRLMRNRTVLTANFAGIIAGIGMYMLMSMIIRYVETPTSTGYGLGASVVVGSLVLLPLSIASYFSSKLATYLGRWLPPGKILPLGLLGFIVALALFAAHRAQLWEIFVVMGIAGVGMGCSFAVMPRMIVSVVAPEETGSALAMNQVLRHRGLLDRQCPLGHDPHRAHGCVLAVPHEQRLHGRRHRRRRARRTRRNRRGGAPGARHRRRRRLR